MPAAPFSISLCADDYAMTPAVSRGILAALDAGALTATSVMTTSPWWPDSAAALKAHALQADIGVHLNLTLGAPLQPMPVLCPSGTFPPIGTFLRAQRSLPLAEIDAEIGRQLDAFETVFGARPDHCDGHQHVHALPPIRALLLRHFDRRGWKGRVWMRDSADRPWRILARRSTPAKALGLAWIARGVAADAATHGVATNEGFAGFSDFRRDSDYAAAFARYLVLPGLRHLVMCHPGRVDEALRRLDPVTETREQELAFLLSPAFGTVLERAGARLVRLSKTVPP